MSSVAKKTLFTPAAARGHPLGPLAVAQAGAGVAFVDNSGSTSGEILKTLQNFTTKLGPKSTALWNSRMEPLLDSAAVSWASRGATAPSAIYSPANFAKIPAEWTGGFTLLTDGEVSMDEVGRLAGHAHKTSHLPTILGIAVNNSTMSADADISRCNVSVLFSHYTAARTALVVVMASNGDNLTAGQDAVLDRVLTVKVLAAKGGWAAAFGPLPDLAAAGATLGDFPTCTVEHINALHAELFVQQPDNTLLVGGGGGGGTGEWLHLDRLMEVQDFAGQVLGRCSECEMEDVVRTFHASGRLPELRHWLQAMSTSFTVAAQQQVESTTDSGGDGMRNIIARLRHATDAGERDALKQLLFGTVAANEEAETATAASANLEAKSSRRLIDAALRAAAAVEQIGMGADLLGRLSNRARRAGKAEATTLEPMETLDLTGAPVVECHVMMMDGPAALLVRQVAEELVEENTNDFAIDFALAVGADLRNQVFCPDIIGIEDGVADQIEKTQKSLSNGDTAVAIPIVTLADPKNKQQVFERLCLALTGGIKLPSVWLVALSAIEHTLATKQWAGSGTPVGLMLHFLGSEIMQHVILPKGHLLAIEQAMPVAAALDRNLHRIEFSQRYPTAGTVTAASAMVRWGAHDGDRSRLSHYAACVTSRAARAVAQQRLVWLKRGNQEGWRAGSDSRLWNAIYDVRETDGIIVPVAGTHKLPMSWSGLLDERDMAALDRFVHVLSSVGGEGGGEGGGNALITPGLALTVRAALGIKNQHISSDRAVEIMCRFHDIAAAETEPLTCGKASDDDVIGVLEKWLAWARQPMVPLTPFATPFGPSTIFFYHNRTQGAGVTNMTDGFKWEINEGGWKETAAERFTRLADYIRVGRAGLLHQEYGYGKAGEFTKKTRSFPLLARMKDVWAAGTEPTEDEFIGEVIGQLLQGRTGNMHHVHLEHDIAMLIPSLVAAGQAITAAAEDRVSVSHRLELELAGRTTDQISTGDAPPAIWVPQNAADAERLERTSSYEQMQDRLAKGRASIETARRAAAVEAAAAQAGVANNQANNKAAPTSSRKTRDQLSRAITKLLRHTAESAGLAIRPDGYVSLEEILALDQFAGVPAEQVDEIMEADRAGKSRLHMMTEGPTVLIRANQGHTITSIKEDQLLTAITDPSEVPICLHGTYLQAWELIKGSHLDRMARTHIQMAVGLPGDTGVKSGIRGSIEVLIYIDVAVAMALGHRFFRSSNNVICTAGPIPLCAFASVSLRKDGSLLMRPSFQRGAAKKSNQEKAPEPEPE